MGSRFCDVRICSGHRLLHLEPVPSWVGAVFEGKLTFEGTVQIEASLSAILTPGHLIVSEGARIEGSLNVASADISGDVHAKITTAGALELRSTAKVVGELTVAALVIERGARFEGQVKMTE